jgi:hypothetical protein
VARPFTTLYPSNVALTASAAPSLSLATFAGPVSIDIDAGPFALAEEEAEEGADRGGADRAAELIASIAAAPAEDLTGGGADGGAVADSGADAYADAACALPQLDGEGQYALAAALREAERWRPGGVLVDITATSFSELLVETGGGGGGGCGGHGGHGDGDGDGEGGGHGGDADEDGDEDEGEEAGGDGDGADASGSGSSARARQQRAARRLLRPGLHVLARVRASFRLRLGCAVIADAGEGAGEAAAGEGNGECEGAQTAPTARPQPPALSLGPLLVAVGSAVSVDVSGLDAWQE